MKRKTKISTVRAVSGRKIPGARVLNRQEMIDAMCKLQLPKNLALVADIDAEIKSLKEQRRNAAIAMLKRRGAVDRPNDVAGADYYDGGGAVYVRYVLSADKGSVLSKLNARMSELRKKKDRIPTDPWRVKQQIKHNLRTGGVSAEERITKFLSDPKLRKALEETLAAISK